MRVFWEALLERLIDLQAPKVIVEVGSDYGALTRLLLTHAPPGRTLHSIDPMPKFEVDALRQEYGEAFVPHIGLSLDVLPNIRDPYELVLLDGDHNWYTVINELRLIDTHVSRIGTGFPLV